MSASLVDLVRKRHTGDGWLFLEEVANATGANVRRYADAVAIGLWPSRGYEIHGYELKVSRGDVRRELDDPSKADAVGKFCDFWWLVVPDLALIDGLLVPEQWGILVPRKQVLRAHRKAPKLDAAPVTRAFMAAVVRKLDRNWVPRHRYDEAKQHGYAEAELRLRSERRTEEARTKRELATLQRTVEAFESASGVKIENEYNAGQIGRAVAAVLEARRMAHREYATKQNQPRAALERELAAIRRDIQDHRDAADALSYGASAIEALITTYANEETP